MVPMFDNLRKRTMVRLREHGHPFESDCQSIWGNFSNRPITERIDSQLKGAEQDFR